MHILHTVSYTFPDDDQENLCNNQKLIYLVIISFTLVTLMYDSGLILWRKISLINNLR